MPQYPGLDQFRGRVLHPQDWPSDSPPAARAAPSLTAGPRRLALARERPELGGNAGKRVVVIGSGATAATLVARAHPSEPGPSPVSGERLLLLLGPRCPCWLRAPCT